MRTFTNRCGGVIVALAVLSVPVAAETCEDQFFDSNGVPIRYCVVGEGAPVIVIHGASGAWRGRVADAFGPLSERFKLIGFDVRGHGKSGKPHDPQDYGPQLGEDVIRLMDHLKIDSVHLVGYSMGGIIGLKLVTVHPDRFRSLVMVGQGIVSPDDLEQMADDAEPRDRADDNDPIALAAMIRSYPVFAVSAVAVRAIRIPVLAVIGDRDPRMARAAALRAALPQAKLVTPPGRDHATVIEDPKMVPEIVSFLSSAEERGPKGR